MLPFFVSNKIYMSNLKRAMKVKGIRYFSQLTPKQKDEASRLFLCIKLNIIDLPKALQDSIINSIEFEKIIRLQTMICKSKMFFCEPVKKYVPLNLSELLQSA